LARDRVVPLAHFEYTEDALEFLKLAHAIMTDAYGRTVRVGLSFEETDEFEHLQKVLNRGRSSFEDSFDEWERLGHRYKELHGKHEMARLEIISAEYHAR
jgi:exonuclease VII small subunit